MKTAILPWALALSLSAGAFAQSLAARGDGAGNGGGAWVCQNNDQLQTIRWAKMVDLYEAEKEFLLPMKDFGNRDYREIVDSQKVRLFSIDKLLYEKLIPHFEEVEANIREVDVDLEVIDDSLYRVRPPARDCLDGKVKYIQLANYTHYGVVLVNEYLFNNPKLSKSDKAALVFHEAIYAYLRSNYQDEDSVRTREIVGYIFSELKNVEIKERVDAVLGHNQDHDQKTPCGLKGSVDERIKDCSYQSTSKKEGFILVTRSKDFYEVHKELSTGLLWSDRLNNSMDHYHAGKACKADLKEVAGIEGLAWRLPSINEYKEAEKNGIRRALPSMNYFWFWSSSVHRDSSDSAWLFNGSVGTFSVIRYNYDFSVRCVAR